MKLMKCCLTVVGVVTLFSGFAECADYEVNTKRGNIPGYYIRSEMQEADRAVEAARSAGKDQACPAEFKAAEDAKNKAYDVFRACHTEEGVALAKDATAKANALCPVKAVAPKPAPVVVPPPTPKATISANPASIEKNGMTTLAWNAENTSECDIMPGVGAVQQSGSRVVSPATSTTYKLACKGAGGDVESSTAVNVIQPPVDSDKDGVIDQLDNCPNTPLGTKVDTVGCPIIECKSATLNITFETNSAEVKPRHNDELKIIADKLAKFPKATAVIEGHTDDVGSDKANQNLSERRAESVKKYIESKFGIKAGRLAAKGFGESKPIDTNKTEDGRRNNRRVVSEFTCPE